MALGALAAEPDCGLKIIPCGMNYFHAHKFRSRAVVEFGSPVEVPAELVDLYKKGERREAIGRLLDIVYQSLVGVTVTSPDYDTLMVGTHPHPLRLCTNCISVAYSSCAAPLQPEGQETAAAHGRRAQSAAGQGLHTIQR